MWRMRLTIDCRINHFGHKGSSEDIGRAREAGVLNYARGFRGGESIFQGDRTHIRQYYTFTAAQIGISVTF